LVSKSNNKHFSDDASIGKRFVIGGGGARVPTYGIIQKANPKNHKRSVSDGGIFNNLGLKNKVIRAAGGLNLPKNEISYNQ